jgi:azurin
MNTAFPALLAFALLGLATHATAAPNCRISLKGDDRMQFDLKSVTVSASCPKISIVLTHVGKLPSGAMGHNVVISPSRDVGAVAALAIKAGAAGGYVPKGDARVIAATPIVGGGATTDTTFAGNKLKPGGDYTFYCSFPGHAAIMKGKLTVTR